MKTPKISIVTPSYNHARFILWTVRSVFLQRYPNTEYVFMDGGSKDNTMELLQPYMDRFAYAISAKDKGQADAISRGFERTTGEIMAYLNSDDMLAPGTLQYVARFFAEHPKVDVIYSHRLAVDGGNKAIWYWLLDEHSNYRQMRWDLIPQETCFWRRRIFEKCGNIDPTFQFAMDYDLFVRFMLKGRFVRAHRFLGAFRVHDGAKTTKLMETIGVPEINRVKQKYGIREHRWDKYIMKQHWFPMLERSRQFAEQKLHLPGALPGLGYDYNDVWAGMLNDSRLPPKVAGHEVDRLAAASAAAS